MNNPLPWEIAAAEADDGKVAAAAEAQVVRRMIVVMLLIAVALDLTRCSLVLAAARHPARPRAGRRRAGRRRTDRADRARMPGRPAPGTLGSVAHRRRVGPASGRVRLPRPLYDPRRGHCCPGDTAGHHHPGDRRPDRPLGHDTENPRVLDRSTAR